MGAHRHTLSNVDDQSRTATCAACGTVAVKRKPSESRWVCAVARRQQKGRRRTGDHVRTVRHREVDAQGGRCAICGAKTRALELDHCHRSGAVRGALCGPCNRGISQLRDSPDLLRRAADYLEAAAGKPYVRYPGRVRRKGQDKMTKPPPTLR